MNDFRTDDQWQREQRDRYLLPLYYQKHFPSFQFCDHLDHYQRRGIDTIIRIGTKTWTVEEKIVRREYDAFAFETKSCTLPGHEKPGWMFYGEADRLIYCFSIPDGLHGYVMDFPKLQTWFWAHEKTFPSFKMETKNQTFGRIVGIKNVAAAGFIIKEFTVTEGSTT